MIRHEVSKRVTVSRGKKYLLNEHVVINELYRHQNSKSSVARQVVVAVRCHCPRGCYVAGGHGKVAAIWLR